MDERLAIDGGVPVRKAPFGPSHEFGDDDIKALTQVIRSGIIGKRGPVIDQFDKEFALRHGAQNAISVTSGTAAMHVCICAINPDPGDEVIVTPWTSGGSIIGALLQNCIPVFAEIDDTLNIDPEDVEAKITPRTRAIIAVHQYGNPCDMDALKEIAERHGIFLIEDCSQAHFAEYKGKLVGMLGDIAGFSLGGKHLSAGIGGIVLCNNDTLWERAILSSDVALPRSNGPYEGRPYANYFLAPGYVVNDLLGAVLLSQLKKVDGYIERKIRAAHQIIQGVSDITELTPQRVRPGDRHTHWVLSFQLETKGMNCTVREFAEAVGQEGVPFSNSWNGEGMEGPLYRQPFLADPATYGRSRFPFDYRRAKPIDYRLVRTPKGEEMMKRTINIQMIPTFTEEDIADIVHAIRKVAIHYRN